LRALPLLREKSPPTVPEKERLSSGRPELGLPESLWERVKELAREPVPQE
jgi:hypothetical protein